MKPVYCSMCDKTVVQTCWFKNPTYTLEGIPVIECEHMSAEMIASMKNREEHIQKSLSQAVLQNYQSQLLSGQVVVSHAECSQCGKDMGTYIRESKIAYTHLCGDCAVKIRNLIEGDFNGK